MEGSIYGEMRGKGVKEGPIGWYIDEGRGGGGVSGVAVVIARFKREMN